MATKLLMSWDVRDGMEETYFEFVVNEFIPKVNQMGLYDIQLWFTSYGDCEQILASGVTETAEQMEAILKSEEWQKLSDRLGELVSDYAQKLIPATRGFQL